MTTERKAAYATKEAAQAMLSRVYLYMSGTYETPNQEYATLSIDYANKVIASGRYHLLSRDSFMKFNTYAPDSDEQTETIFAVKQVASEFSGYDHFYGIGGMYANIQGQGWGEMYASAKYLDLLRKSGLKKDARWALSILNIPQMTQETKLRHSVLFMTLKMLPVHRRVTTICNNH